MATQTIENFNTLDLETLASVEGGGKRTADVFLSSVGVLLKEFTIVLALELSHRILLLVVLALERWSEPSFHTRAS